MTRALTMLVALVLLAAPAVAPAREPLTNAPPGNSAIDEYLETVPGATGNQVPRRPGTGGHVLTPAQRKRLEALGPDGKALADVVDATAPPPAKPGQKKIDLDNAKGRSPVSAVIEAATGSDGGAGMGIFLPIILLASLVGTIVLVVLRRRSAS